MPSRTYTPLGDPLDVIFEKLAKANLICYPPTQPNEQSQSKASWYKVNEYCKFHRVKIHTTLKCMQLKDYVQGLIDQKEIIVGAQTSHNEDLQIYQNAFPSHNLDTSKAPLQNNTVNNTNQKNNAQEKQGDKSNTSQDYTSTYLDYGNLIGCVSETKPSINVINIQGPNNECAITT